MKAVKPPFFPLSRRLHEHLASDPIGDIGFVRAGGSIADAPPDHPSFSPERGGGALLSIGIYETFLAVCFLGGAIDVQALGKQGPTGVDGSASLNVGHEEGISCVAGWNWTAKATLFLPRPRGASPSTRTGGTRRERRFATSADEPSNCTSRLPAAGSVTGLPIFASNSARGRLTARS